MTPVITGGVRVLVEFGSLVGELTLAVLVSEPLACSVIITRRLLRSPLFTYSKLLRSMPLLFTPLPLALTNVTDAGKVSVTSTLLATDGPRLVTEIRSEKRRVGKEGRSRWSPNH